MKKKYSLKLISFSIILVLVVSVASVINIVSFVNDKKQTDSNYNQNGKLLISIAKNMIDREVEGYEETLKTLSEGENYSDLTQLRNRMILLDNNNKNILSIYFGRENDGSYVQSLDHELPEGYNAKSRPWYKDSSERQNEYIVQSPYVDPTTGKNVITISKAVVHNNSLVGVVGMDIELTALSNELSSIKYGSTGQVIISAKDGLTISSTDQSKIGGQEVTKYSVWNDVLNNTDGETQYSYNNTKYKGYYCTSDKTGWKIMLNTEVSELNSSLNSRVKSTIIIMIIIIIISMLIVNLLTGIVGKSVKKLSGMMYKAAEGNFDEYIKLDSVVKEFIVLENSFNKMKDNLFDLLNSVNESVDNVDDTVVKSMKMSEDISASIDQVGATMGEIAGGTNQCSVDLEEIVKNMQQLSDSINMIDDRTNKVNSVASETNNLGSKGIKIADIVLKNLIRQKTAQKK